MVKFAGYDVVVQVHRDTLADLASADPVAGGHLFGGPFMAAFEGDLPPDGLNLGIPYWLSATMEAELQARVAEDTATVRLTVSDGVLTLGDAGREVPISGVHAAVDVVVPIRFRYLLGLDDHGNWTPQTQDAAAMGEEVPAPQAIGVRPAFEECEVVVTLDPTEAVADAMFDLLGQKGVDRLQHRLARDIKQYLATRENPARPLGPFALRVVSGTASTNLDTLAQWPVLCWLDADTLACFGTYRADGPTAIPTLAVGSSDLDQEPTEFITPSRPIGGHTLLPTRPAMLSISTDAVRRVVFCPAVRRHLSSELAHLGYREDWIKDRRRSGEGAANADERAAWLAAYQRYQKTMGPQEAHARAAEDLDAWTTRRLVASYLDSDEGAATVEAHTPADCGAGPVSVDVTTAGAPDPTLTVRRVWLESTDGALLVSMRGHVDGPVCGRLNAEVDLRIRPVVASDRKRVDAVPEVVRQDTETSDTTLCEALLALLVMPFAGPAWGVLAGLIAGHLARSLTDAFASRALAEALAGQLQRAGAELPTTDTARLSDVRVDAVGISVVAVVARAVLHINDARAGAWLDIERIARTRDHRIPTFRGRIHKERSCVDDSPRDFAYEVQAFAETWQLRLTHSNLSEPVRLESATLTLGDWYGSRLAQSGLLEPAWRDPVPLVDGSLVLPGPATLLRVPDAEDLVVPEVTVVAEAAAEGWKLLTRGDGVFAFQVAGEAVDALGRRVPVRSIAKVTGREVRFGADMAEEEQACLDRLREKLDEAPPIVEIVDLPPWHTRWIPTDMQVPTARRELTLSNPQALVDLVRRTPGDVG